MSTYGVGMVAVMATLLPPSPEDSNATCPTLLVSLIARWRRRWCSVQVSFRPTLRHTVHSTVAGRAGGVRGRQRGTPGARATRVRWYVGGGTRGAWPGPPRRGSGAAWFIMGD